VNIDLDAALLDGSSLASILINWRPAWMAAGACIGRDREVFFGQTPTAARRAKAICASCPVLVECREFALEDPGTVGVWGGTSSRDRQKLRVQRAA
jgi:WhiB family redox-sensing transcriptional regulator